MWKATIRGIFARKVRLTLTALAVLLGVAFVTGTYVLTARADDGVRVWVDGDLVINAWRDQSATTYTANRQLSGEHAVVVEYYENGGQAVAQFGWEQADP